MNESARHYSIAYPALTIVCCVVAIITMCMIICCLGRKTPHNYILLFIFTVCESYMVAGLTARYERNTVIAAGATTALVAVSLTIYAMFTKVRLEIFYAMVFVIYLAMLPMMILCFILRLPALHIIYCALGLIMYSLFLIIDTIQICKSVELEKKHGPAGLQMTFDDYVIGALNLYLDIIMIFIYLLNIFGSRE